MILNIIVFVVPFIVPSWFEPMHQYGGLNGYWIFVRDEPHRFLTSMFLHNDAMHIVMNALSIYLVGRVVEKLFSPLAYISIYFITGIFGSLLYVFISPMAWAAGASGAIFGIFGALAGFAWIHRKRMYDEFMNFMRSFGLILLFNLLIGFTLPNVAMSAHIGGLVAGIASGMVVARYPKQVWFYILASMVMILLVSSYLPSLYTDYVTL